ncbi:hypothetical protein OG609_21320 [Streptomyces sp. NBC_01224]|uniref:hypothetical protein n=1 Tax=Streptomyces sp. NBC_01224 TaxID=2903783 RepID=UPI002E159D36|nr:hypothetical protein OG609_21320 [Streptomyces sp. NBC_01224]
MSSRPRSARLRHGRAVTRGAVAQPCPGKFREAVEFGGHEVAQGDDVGVAAYGGHPGAGLRGSPGPSGE